MNFNNFKKKWKFLGKIGNTSGEFKRHTIDIIHEPSIHFYVKKTQKHEIIFPRPHTNSEIKEIKFQAKIQKDSPY
jgi:hypothetical protein